MVNNQKKLHGQSNMSGIYLICVNLCFDLMLSGYSPQLSFNKLWEYNEISDIIAFLSKGSHHI